MQHARLRGRDLHAPSNELVSNNTGADIAAMKVVALDGMGAVYPKIKLADPAQFFNFGVAPDEIKNGKFGLVTTLGFMFEVDTSAWLIDTLLYSTNTGDLTTTVNGDPIARVIHQSATIGVIYVLGGAMSGGGGGSTPAWDIDGNAGLSPANFLGTTDAVALRFRTDNIERAVIDAQGRFGLGTTNPGMFHEIKAHTNANASGLQTETFYVETNALGFATAFVLSISDPMFCQVTFSATCREPSSPNFGSFKRTGMFYRDASSVQIVDGWASDFTQKTNNLINVQYTLSVGAVTFRVRPATAQNTRWTGYVQVQRLI